jgi:holin-like protein
LILGYKSNKIRNFAGQNKTPTMLVQCAIIFICLLVGEAIVSLTGCKIPGSIIGMLFLTLMLQLRVVKPRHVDKISKFLLANLGFFFIPAGVGLMLYLDLIENNLLAIIITAAVSTIIVMVATGLVHQLLRRHANNRK